jgi:hypothetical protein
MDVKTIMNPRRGMILSGAIVLLLLGLGPISGGMSGDTEMFTSEDYGDIYADASTEDKETIDKMLSVSEFSIGAAGVSIAVFIIALAFLTEGTTQAKAALLSGSVIMIWGFLTCIGWYLQDFGFFVEMMVMFAIFAAPMFISGMLHLKGDE